MLICDVVQDHGPRSGRSDIRSQDEMKGLTIEYSYCLLEVDSKKVSYQWQ